MHPAIITQLSREEYEERFGIKTKQASVIFQVQLLPTKAIPLEEHCFVIVKVSEPHWAIRYFHQSPLPVPIKGVLKPSYSWLDNRVYMTEHPLEQILKALLNGERFRIHAEPITI